jgi:HTH-type transcriptional repressor of NAD biosynthesis genes
LATLINTISNWDLVLFLEPTVPFVQDGTRSDRIAEERKQCSDMLKGYYERAGVPFATIGGDYLTRYQQAQMLIKYHCGV